MITEQTAVMEKERLYTVDDSDAWDERFRCELIYGRIYVNGHRFYGEPPKAGQYLILPEEYEVQTPSTNHQRIAVNLLGHLWNYFRGNQIGEVIPAPYGVELFGRLRSDTFVQPDISVILDRSIVTNRGCEGAPDIVVEALSPSTMKHDLSTKLELYKKAGVKEVWFVNPDDYWVMTVAGDGGNVNMDYHKSGGMITTELLPGLSISVNGIFGLTDTEQQDEQGE